MWCKEFKEHISTLIDVKSRGIGTHTDKYVEDDRA